MKLHSRRAFFGQRPTLTDSDSYARRTLFSAIAFTVSIAVAQPLVRSLAIDPARRFTCADRDVMGSPSVRALEHY